MMRKLLIANRGEIVNRIITSSKRLNITPVVVWSKADYGLDYLQTDIEKYQLEGNTLSETYLNGDQIIAIAKRCGAGAIHPGYGFLAENIDFAIQCQQSGLIWIGPSPAVMQKMSGKESSRKQAIAAGVPVLDAFSGTPEELIKESVHFTYPILIKAVSGGGGRGMRIIHHAEEFKSQAEIASREAAQFFSDPRIFVEQYIGLAKHIEVQVLGDHHGNLIHLFERECTIQRRYQKIIEESPSPALSPEQRERILTDAVKLAKESGYNSVGTLEFLLDQNGQHYFMEMNTRIQVEHPVTEMITGVDLVAQQILIADGNRLSISQDQVKREGHAIECRVCAEDPESDFDPRPGLLSFAQFPQGEGIRIEHAIGKNFEVSPLFDSLIAKVLVHESDRNAALRKMRSVLAGVVIHGVVTTLDFLLETINHQQFIQPEFYTNFIRKYSGDMLISIAGVYKDPPISIYEAALQTLAREQSPETESESSVNPWLIEGYWRQVNSKILDCHGNSKRVEIRWVNAKPNGAIVCSIHPDRSVWVSSEGKTFRLTDPALTRILGNPSDTTRNLKATNDIRVFAPLPGLLSRLVVNPGDLVAKGDLLAIIESMKTENRVLSEKTGRIGAINVTEGQQVKLNELILEIENN
jgi:3-methylcrotonyl-CoA carboxylase alpha subunit